MFTIEEFEGILKGILLNTKNGQAFVQAVCADITAGDMVPENYVLSLMDLEEMYGAVSGNMCYLYENDASVGNFSMSDHMAQLEETEGFKSEDVMPKLFNEKVSAVGVLDDSSVAHCGGYSDKCILCFISESGKLLFAEQHSVSQQVDEDAHELFVTRYTALDIKDRFSLCYLAGCMTGMTDEMKACWK